MSIISMVCPYSKIQDARHTFRMLRFIGIADLGKKNKGLLTEFVLIAQTAPIRLGDPGLDLLYLQCSLPATLNCYLATRGYTLNTV